MEKVLMYIFLIVIALSLKACMGDGMTDAQRNYIRSLKQNKPSEKEDKYRLTLQERGFKNMKFEIPHIGEVCKGCSSYQLSMECSFLVTENNKDSVLRLNRQIALDLYNDIITDSLIEDIGEVKIIFITNYHGSSGERIVHLKQKYPKDSLEKWNGFKVVKTGKDEFKRILLDNPSK